ncbi:hypothetical protein FEZ32_06245 [Acidipropionibacterium jensenii]|uniref:hypothetical protein n=1 Tax=Acidipropionibacterium jensenii TaxID=1749 RepID=UPI00110AA9E6|nr:hypothetical protein [Acidipropionibacterium jensenii]QCV88014.1 hypothetical protein FEZ32_06245 [Acidipropionibacterium jensenii]
MPDPSFSELVTLLRNEAIDAWLKDASSDIDTVAFVLGVDPQYLRVQVMLHIPFYTWEELQSQGIIVVVRRVLSRLRQELDEFSSIARVHRQLNGADLVRPGALLRSSYGELTAERSDAESSPILFDAVPPAFANSIQKDIHYIHSVRRDTIFHAGLRFIDHPAPFAYAAFSELDRVYLKTALKASMQGTVDVADSRVVVMTRAFGYSPTPKNAMSKLFDLSAQRLQELGYEWIITAINPFLGFKGSIFSGSSYFPFATSPMHYKYTAEGAYITRRRSPGVERQEQRLITPPILWLARPMGRPLRRRLEKANISLYNISDEEYQAG